MLNFKKITLTAIAIGLTSTSAFADSFYDYARVIKTKPVYEYVRVSQPVQQCYQVERRTKRHHRNHHDRSGSTVAGALVGGVIGNIIGQNSESTLAGAVIGGAIGHSSRNRHHRGTRITEHCETVYQPAKKVRKIKGYNVKYRYNGEKYKTFMRHHPGDKVKVRVSFSPVGYD